MPTRRGARAAQSPSMQRILRAARQRFERFGYRRTGMAEIAQDAGLATGTLYRYFESKEDLLRRVVGEAGSEWLEVAQGAIEEPGDAIERLRRLTQASVEYNRRSGLLDAVLRRDADIILAPLLDELYGKQMERSVALMAEVIREGVAEGTLRAVDPERVAFVLFVAGRSLYEETRYPYKETVEVFRELTLQGLLRTAADA